MSTQKRGDTYYSRIVVPSSLRRVVPRREVVKSLHVHTYSAARLRCAEWEARLYGLLETLKTRGQELSGREFNAELGKLGEAQDGTNHGAQYSTPTAHTTLIGASPAVGAAGDLLSVVISAYVGEHSGGSWTDKTTETIEGCLGDFVQILGDIPAAAVSRASLRQYKETLQKVPPNRTKKFPGVAIATLAQQTHPHTLSSTTINRNLGFVSSFFSWAALNSYVPANPTAGAKLKIRKSTTIDEERLPFTDDDLARVFGGDYWKMREESPERFWIPPLMSKSNTVMPRFTIFRVDLHGQRQLRLRSDRRGCDIGFAPCFRCVVTVRNCQRAQSGIAGFGLDRIRGCAEAPEA